MAEKIICESCGGTYDSSLAKCPYCDTLNISGAESEYMGKLGDVREGVDSLKEVPKEELRQAARRSGRYLKKVVIGVIAVGLVLGAVTVGWTLWERHLYGQYSKEDYLWREENYPILDQMFAQGKYEELVEFEAEASAQGHSIYEWQHSEFIYMYESIRYAAQTIEEDAAGQEMTWRSYSVLLHDQWRIKGIENSKRLSDEEKAILAPLAEPVLEDFESRWDFPEETYEKMCREMEESGGYVSFDLTDSYAKTWFAENRK